MRTMGAALVEIRQAGQSSTLTDADWLGAAKQLDAAGADSLLALYGVAASAIISSVTDDEVLEAVKARVQEGRPTDLGSRLLTSAPASAEVLAEAEGIIRLPTPASAPPPLCGGGQRWLRSLRRHRRPSRRICERRAKHAGGISPVRRARSGSRRASATFSTSRGAFDLQPRLCRVVHARLPSPGGADVVVGPGRLAQVRSDPA